MCEINCSGGCSECDQEGHRAESAEPVGYAEVGYWGLIDPSTCTTFYRDQDQKPLYIHPQPQSADVAKLVEALREIAEMDTDICGLVAKEALAKHGG